MQLPERGAKGGNGYEVGLGKGATKRERTVVRSRRRAKWPHRALVKKTRCKEPINMHSDKRALGGSPQAHLAPFKNQ